MLYSLILAAGESARFGAPKQLARVGGVPLLRLVANRAAEVTGAAVTIVLGARSAELIPALGRSTATIVINRDWREGIASSIRAGVARLPGSCSGVLLLLADQAAVTAAELARIADVWRRAPRRIVAAQYAGVTGIPAIFPRTDFAALRELRGDRGARALLRQRSDRVIGLPLPSAAIDIDTPADLAGLQEANGTDAGKDTETGAPRVVWMNEGPLTLQ